MRRHAPFVAAVAFLIGPERQRAADDGTCGDRSEITAIEAVGDVPIHEEELAFANGAAALPDRKFAAQAVALQRFAHLDPVAHGSLAAGASHPLLGWDHVLVMVAVVVVLVRGLVNMMRGGSGNTSNKLMQARVFLQFIALVLIMLALWFSRSGQA